VKPTGAWEANVGEWGKRRRDAHTPRSDHLPAGDHVTRAERGPSKYRATLVRSAGSRDATVQHTDHAGPMSVDMLQVIIGIAGLGLALIGPPLLFLQLRDVKRSVRSGAHAALYSQRADSRAQLVQLPYPREYFYDGKDRRGA